MLMASPKQYLELWKSDQELFMKSVINRYACGQCEGISLHVAHQTVFSRETLQKNVFKGIYNTFQVHGIYGLTGWTQFFGGAR